ncbi:MAG: TRAP transporter small permease [Firmicutes bacterium]|jgi:TRAP-type C4-dicarboxylate transport system permease small subunit|nr:TRAP transporter small permease [Bacillota bacterium]
MDKIIRSYEKVCQKFDLIGAIILLVICLIVVLNIILRAVFNNPIYGAYEYVCYLSVVVISFALANCAIQGGHTNVTFLLEKFSLKTQRIITIITETVIFVNFLLIMWKLAEYAQKTYLAGDVSSNLRIPLHYVVVVIVAGIFLLALFSLLKIIETIKKPS